MGSVGLAIVLAILAIWLDRNDRPAGDAYSRDGWYWTWLMGVFATGLVSLIVVGRLG